MKNRTLILSALIIFATGCKEKREVDLLAGIPNISKKCEKDLNLLETLVDEKKISNDNLEETIKTLEALPGPSKKFSDLIQRFQKAPASKKNIADFLTGASMVKCKIGSLYKVFDKLFALAKMNKALKSRLIDVFKRHYLNPDIPFLIIDAHLPLVLGKKHELNKEGVSIKTLVDLRSELKKYTKTLNEKVDWQKLDTEPESITHSEAEKFKAVILEELEVAQSYKDKTAKLF